MCRFLEPPQVSSNMGGWWPKIVGRHVDKTMEAKGFFKPRNGALSTRKDDKIRHTISKGLCRYIESKSILETCNTCWILEDWLTVNRSSSIPNDRSLNCCARVFAQLSGRRHLVRNRAPIPLALYSKARHPRLFWSLSESLLFIYGSAGSRF